MDMHFRVLAQLKIDYRFQVLYIKTTCSHIGGHQDGTTLVGKLYQNLIPVPLLQITMQRKDAKTLCLQSVCNYLALLFGVAEDHTRRWSIMTQ